MSDSSSNALRSSHTACSLNHWRFVALVALPLQAVADKANGEDGQAGAEQSLPRDVQDLDTGDDLLLKHVGRLVIQHGRLVAQMEAEREREGGRGRAINTS